MHLPTAADADTPSVEQSNAVEIFLNGVGEFWPLWVLLGAVLVEIVVCIDDRLASAVG